jgi:hypothetical protein
METFSQSNTIKLHFGRNYMSRAIPVFEREQRKTYELQTGKPRRRLLKNYWKQDPPMSDDKHIKLVLHGNQEKLYHWCKYHQSWTIHSPKECGKQCSARRKFRRNNGCEHTGSGALEGTLQGTKNLGSGRGHSTRNLKEEPRPPRTHKRGHQKLRTGLRGEYEKALIPL